MLLNDYSQLPVMTGDRTVHGLISWKSIGKGTCGRDRQDREWWTAWTPRFEWLSGDMPLLRAVGRDHPTREIVLVPDRAKKIVGIVTTTDLSVQLRDLTDAFLLIGNIERQLRRLMGNRFDLDVLRSFVPRDSSRVVQGVEDLSFGEYLRLLQVPEHWSKLGLKVDSRSC